MPTGAGHSSCTLCGAAPGRPCLRSCRVPRVRLRAAYVHHVSGGVGPARPAGRNHQPTRVVDPRRGTPGDPPVRLVHIHVQPDRQTARAVGRAQRVEPRAAHRPDAMEIGQLPEVAHNEILAADVPHGAKGQGGRRLDRKLAAVLTDVGACADDHQVSAGNHLAQNSRDLEPGHVIICAIACGLTGPLLDHHVVRPLEPAGHVGDVRQRRTHRHTAQQWQPTQVRGAADRHRNDGGHGDRGARRRPPLTRQPSTTRALIIGHHDPPRTGVSQRLEVRGVDGRMDIDHLPRVWRRDQCRFH